MDTQEVKEVEKLIDLKENKKLREKRKRRKALFSKLWKGVFLSIVAVVSVFLLTLLTSFAPEEALTFYNGCALVTVIRVLSTWLDRPRRKK